MFSQAELAALMDHTLLGAEVSEEQVTRACEQALAASFRAVCVPANRLETVARAVQGTTVKAVTVVGFPFGNTTLHAKLFEALEALRLGADEIDVVLNISAVKAGERKTVLKEITEIMARTPECKHKFIIEIGLLDPPNIEFVCKLANQAKPAFLKTSTGFLARPTSPEDVRTLRSRLHPEVAIKAAGGIRTLRQVEELVEAGAAVIGTSRALDILAEAET